MILPLSRLGREACGSKPRAVSTKKLPRHPCCRKHRRLKQARAPFTPIMFKAIAGEWRFSMADMAASVLSLHTGSMTLVAHLEELRKRIIFSVLGILVGFISCWSFADRIFGLMQQPIIGALRHHGLGGGLVYLNPTEPFNLYLEVALVGGLFVASPFVFYQLWLFIAPGLYRKEKGLFRRFLFRKVPFSRAGGFS